MNKRFLVGCFVSVLLVGVLSYVQQPPPEQEPEKPVMRQVDELTPQELEANRRFMMEVHRIDTRPTEDQYQAMREKSGS